MHGVAVVYVCLRLRVLVVVVSACRRWLCMLLLIVAAVVCVRCCWRCVCLLSLSVVVVFDAVVCGCGLLMWCVISVACGCCCHVCC